MVFVPDEYPFDGMADTEDSIELDMIAGGIKVYCGKRRMALLFLNYTRCYTSKYQIIVTKLK